MRYWEVNKKPEMDMWTVLETTLGPLALGIYQSRKTDNPAVITEQKTLVNNPYNFTSFIRLLLIGNDPGKGGTLIENTAIRNLEQLSIRDFKYIKEFSQDFVITLAQTGIGAKHTSNIRRLSVNKDVLYL